MRRKRRIESETVEMPMGPMIDMVFLLLVFFMVSAKPVKPEADISIGLPGQVSQEEALDIPDEQRIVILESGRVMWNERSMGGPKDRNLEQLVIALKRFRIAAENNRADPLISLAPQDSVKHQRIVDVLNACAVAELKGITFAAGRGSLEGGQAE